MTPIILATLAGGDAFHRGLPGIASLDLKLRTLIDSSNLTFIGPMLQAWYQSYEHEQHCSQFRTTGHLLK